MAIPYVGVVPDEKKIPVGRAAIGREEKILFSFESIERDEFFNLDGTCANWSSDLFDALKYASEIKISDVYAGKYSGKNSTFRIHQHKNVKNPCSIPHNVSLDEMWQIRISKSKGGIHGVFVENVFFVVWFDPHHNLYPDSNHGGLKKIIPPSTCCKDRDDEIAKVNKENERLSAELRAAEALLEERGN